MAGVVSTLSKFKTLVDITINYDNQTSNIITVGSGDIVDIEYVSNGKLDKAKGKITAIDCGLNLVSIDTSSEYSASKDEVLISAIRSISIVPTSTI